GRLLGSQLGQHADPVHVRQVDVQQHQVGLVLLNGAQRFGAGMGGRDHLETLDPRDVPAVDPGDHEVVVDHQNSDHGCPSSCLSGRCAVNTAPVALCTCTDPPRRWQSCLVSASPKPRGPLSAALVVKPCRKTSSTISGVTPGPESRTTTVTSSVHCKPTSIHRSPVPPVSTASSALSTRLPSTVT